MQRDNKGIILFGIQIIGLHYFVAPWIIPFFFIRFTIVRKANQLCDKQNPTNQKDSCNHLEKIRQKKALSYA